MAAERGASIFAHFVDVEIRLYPALESHPALHVLLGASEIAGLGRTSIWSEVGSLLAKDCFRLSESLLFQIIRDLLSKGVSIQGGRRRIVTTHGIELLFTVYTFLFSDLAFSGSGDWRLTLRRLTLLRPTAGTSHNVQCDSRTRKVGEVVVRKWGVKKVK